MTHCHALLLSAALLAAAPAFAAEVPEAVKHAASATEKGLKKAEAATVHGLKAGASGAERGMAKAGAAVDHTAKRLGAPGGPARPASSGLAAAKSK